MRILVNGVYLIDFGANVGAEFSGKHYGIVLTQEINHTVLVVPITSKKSGKKYRYGITIDNNKYLVNPKYAKAFASVNKIREIDRQRILGKCRYHLDSDDSTRLKEKIKDFLAL